MVERFNALADHGLLDFEAWFNQRSEPDRSWEVDEKSWRFRYRYLPTTRFGNRVLRWPAPSFGRRPDMIVSLYAEPVFLFGWAIAKLRGITTGFWVEVTFDKWVRRRWYKELIKKWLFKRLDVVVTVGNDGKAFSMKYGAEPENIRFAPHVIDFDYFQSSSGISAAERFALRLKLGIRGVTFVYVGRLWWGKGVNNLLEAFEHVQRMFDEETSLLLVGDGEAEAGLKQECIERGIRNVVFAGFRQKPELPPIYAASDVFVFPTLGDPYGLVVDEAMACSLPVISTSSAGEIRDRITEGVNGYVVPPGDCMAMAERMLALANQPVLRQRMGENAAASVKGQTPDRWASDFERIVSACLAKPVG